LVYGAILPGISSGVLCVVFNIYDKLVASILNLFKDFKKNFLFLLPFGLGGIIGALLVSRLLKFLFNFYPMQTQFCFIGLIIGSIPILIKRANEKSGFRLHYLIPLIATFLIGLLSIKLETFLPYLINSNITENHFFYFIFSGFLMSIGIVIPGVSSSVILMTLGVYDIYISSVATINLKVLFPLLIGIIIGSFIFLKIIDYLLKKHYSSTFYGIIGFVLGSVLVLYPGISLDFTGLISIFLCILGFFISTKLG